jgi:hypothetical protein
MALTDQSCYLVLFFGECFALADPAEQEVLFYPLCPLFLYSQRMQSYLWHAQESIQNLSPYLMH